jgi:D-alanyl-D-alanine carboxypeptidase
MKTLALLTILALQTLGWWPHLPDHARQNLVTAGTTDRAHPAAPPAHPAPIPALPVPIDPQPLQLPAASAFAVDAATGTVLYAQNAGARRPIASITKLVTVMVILSRHSPDELIRIPQLPNYQPADERIGLTAGETYRLDDLVRAALINSANDAADALALADAGTMPKFAARMNAKMAEWGITGTRFSNPTGLQDADNYASAEALAKIATLALANPLIRQTVSQPAAVITSRSGRTLNLTTTDDLLATGQFYGIKTGYTQAAGECFVGLTRIAGHEVVTVVLGADDRFGTTQALRTWIEQHWQWL